MDERYSGKSSCDFVCGIGWYVAQSYLDECYLFYSTLVYWGFFFKKKILLIQFRSSLAILFVFCLVCGDCLAEWPIFQVAVEELIHSFAGASSYYLFRRDGLIPSKLAFSSLTSDQTWNISSLHDFFWFRYLNVFENSLPESLLQVESCSAIILFPSFTREWEFFVQKVERSGILDDISLFCIDLSSLGLFIKLFFLWCLVFQTKWTFVHFSYFFPLGYI